jgi:hypothetical protein
MTDPAGSDRIQQDDVPSPSGTGEDGALAPSSGDAPPSRDEAIERDSAHDDQQPARPGSDVGLLDRADPDGSA